MSKILNINSATGVAYTMQFMAIGGGGGGGGAFNDGGGGGGGEVKYAQCKVNQGDVLTIMVGDAVISSSFSIYPDNTTSGVSPPSNGNPTSITSSNPSFISNFTANGGGNGADVDTSISASSGGSGGGGANTTGLRAGASGIIGTYYSFANNGGSAPATGTFGGGGGGGAYQVGGSAQNGNNPPTGGSGGNGFLLPYPFSISYIATLAGGYVAGGGGGANTSTGIAQGGVGGLGGGGTGGNGNSFYGNIPAATINNTGAGGGAIGSPVQEGGYTHNNNGSSVFVFPSGGQGSAILVIPKAFYTGTYTGNVQVTSDNTYYVLSFIGSGTYTV
jgi:hypothetical protein